MNLNWRQKVIVLAGMILILLSIVFPCWIFYYDTNQYEIVEYRYAFLLTPPEALQTEGYRRQGDPLRAWHIDWSRITYQIATIILMTIGGTIVTSSKKNSN
jgi:hypothetical protein